MEWTYFSHRDENQMLRTGVEDGRRNRNTDNSLEFCFTGLDHFWNFCDIILLLIMDQCLYVNYQMI